MPEPADLPDPRKALHHEKVEPVSMRLGELVRMPEWLLRLRPLVLGPKQPFGGDTAFAYHFRRLDNLAMTRPANSPLTPVKWC